MTQQKISLLPWFSDSFNVGKSGTIAPFYVENGTAKSGHSTHGDWIDETLSDNQVERITKNGFPIGGGTVFEFGKFKSHDRVCLIFPGEYNEKVVIFWEALIFLCTGRFFGKQVFLRGSESSLLSSQDRRTLSHLQDFFSNETGFGAEKCNMLFDTDRNVIIVRGEIGDKILKEPFSFPDREKNYEDLKRVVSQFLDFGHSRMTDQEWEDATDRVSAAAEKYSHVDLGEIAMQVTEDHYNNM